MLQFMVLEGSSFAEYQVSGTTYGPEGEIRTSNGAPLTKASLPMTRLAHICALCNDAKISFDEVSLLPLTRASHPATHASAEICLVLQHWRADGSRTQDACGEAWTRHGRHVALRRCRARHRRQRPP